MITEFYKKVLPSTGVYCIATKDPGEGTYMKHKFVEDIDEIEPTVQELVKTNTNIYVALSSFDGYSRKAENAKLDRKSTRLNSSH